MNERRRPGEEVRKDAERPTDAGGEVVRVEGWMRKSRRQPVNSEDDTSGPDPGPSAA